ncbi:MAG: Ppx/GppA family phosphatase [Planctomycetes bacterium]|nr:Ppx/GppA family phosphatase [Planctomycetota bacterium]
MKLAVMDLGTNSIHMYLVSIEGDDYRILGREREMARLGDGCFREGRFPAETFYRGIETVRRFHQHATGRGIRRFFAFATSAVRFAANGGEFLEQVRKLTGMRVRVLSGEEEARLVFLAVQNSIDLDGVRAAVLDIGGGSLEVAVGEKERILLTTCLPLGCARLRDEFMHSDPISRRDLRRLEEEIDHRLEAGMKKVAALKPALLVGTSGTLQNLTQIAHRRGKSSPLEQMHCARLTRDDVEEVCELLAPLSHEERLEVPGMDPDRCDLILPGALTVRRALQRLKFAELTISERAVREGAILDYMERNKGRLELEKRVPDVRLRNVMALLERCTPDTRHAEQVTRLALALFDGTARLHGLGPAERELMHYAALLHDIGYLVSYERHHRHSAYLIANTDLDGFAREEILILANVARYHRRSPPRPRHKEFATLSHRARRTVEVLSGLLRVAEGLDRGHYGIVRALRVRIDGTGIAIVAETAGDPSLELWAASRHLDLLESVLKRAVRVKVEKSGATGEIA